MEIDRKQILLSVLETIEGIASKDYQIRVWILGRGPEVDDFDEICCNFFGDGDPLLDNYKDFGITENQYEILKKFRDEFAAFSHGPALNYYFPHLFIDKPEWTKVTELAAEVLDAFGYQKNRTIYTEHYKNYVREVACLLKDNAKKAKIDADNPKEGDSADFNSGFLMAYHQVITIMKNQAPFFKLYPSNINLADIVPERDLI